jgi:hypothetical protein
MATGQPVVMTAVTAAAAVMVCAHRLLSAGCTIS